MCHPCDDLLRRMHTIASHNRKFAKMCRELTVAPILQPEGLAMIRTFYNQTKMELLERGEYLAGLEAALAEARGGAGRMALVSGEAGIGKTTLIEAFVARHQTEARVLWGACDSL